MHPINISGLTVHQLPDIMTEQLNELESIKVNQNFSMMNLNTTQIQCQIDVGLKTADPPPLGGASITDSGDGGGAFYAHGGASDRWKLQSNAAHRSRPRALGGVRGRKKGRGVTLTLSSFPQTPIPKLRISRLPEGKI